MDEFDVLVESIGFKPERKSAPIAILKSKSRNTGFNSCPDTKHLSGNRSKPVFNSNSFNGSFHIDQRIQNSGHFNAFNNVFGGDMKNSNTSGGHGFDLDSILNGSNNGVNSSLYDDDDDDIFGVMPSRSAPTEGFLGNFRGRGLASNGYREKKAQELDDLIPGFGGRSPSRNGENTETSWSSLSNDHPATPISTSVDDPFVFLEQSSPRPYSSSGLFSEPMEKDSGRSSFFSSFDELEGFAIGKVQNKTNEKSNQFQKERAESATHDLDSFFRMGSKPTSGSRHKSKAVDPVYDSLFQSIRNPEAIFGEVAPLSGEFQEMEGKSEERRKSRLNHHTKTLQRMAQALADKNQRDFQTRQEQEERHRIADTLDDYIKRWAAGKEGNLRALLSSLQDVLWPECGWQPVSSTDLITSVSVKKVYYKATLCVHPDKVQQKGANIEQKYITEKIFGHLKEAWNKFNAEKR